MKMKTILFAALACISFYAYAGDKEGGTDAASRKLLDPANMDRSVKPGDNFFLFANGAWLKKTPIPADQTRWGSFNELQENNYKALHALLEAAAAARDAAPGSNVQKVGSFYRSGMDTNMIEQQRFRPLDQLLRRIDMMQNSGDIMRFVAVEHTMGVGSIFAFYVAPDDKNVTVEIPQFFQGGLGMPDRDYYFKKDDRTEKIREAYKKYLASVCRMLNIDGYEKAAHQIYELETALANASMTRVEMRDPYKLYNKFTLQEAEQKMPGISWTSLFQTMRIGNEKTMIVGQPEFFAQVGKELRNTPISVWKNYLKFHLVNDMAPFLHKEVADAHFNFYGKTVRGQEAQKPRWQRVLTVIDGSIGELLGQMYVEKNFRPEAKKRMLELVNNLQQTYAERIQRLDWMSEQTKTRALAKLNTFMKKIGYPDKWKDYAALQIQPNDYVQNIMQASAFEYNYNISKLGKPVDKTEWAMTPPTVNAYYNPAFNEIVFPAGILQYPFFDAEADDAVNYGGIGAVIGHEMTHGFDDQGRQYDADGNLNDWWTEEDAALFTKKAQVVTQQFNQYTVLDTMHVNGELTLGENLADLGGLAIAYEAFKKTPQGKSDQRIDNFTPDQRFFLSWAQVWRANTRPEELAARIVTDPHSPSVWRCNGPLSNMQEFYDAFEVKPGDKMYRSPKERAKVW